MSKIDDIRYEIACLEDDIECMEADGEDCDDAYCRLADLREELRIEESHDE